MTTTMTTTTTTTMATIDIRRDKLPVMNHFRFRFAAHAHYLKVDRKKIENKISDGLIFLNKIFFKSLRVEYRKLGLA